MPCGAGPVLAMKKLLLALFAVLFSFFTCVPGWAQGQTPVKVIGKDKGEVTSLLANGITYLDVQQTAKKIGANVELYSAAKQAKVTLKGFSSILTAGESQVILNGQPVALGESVIAYRGRIMAPVAFFTLPALGKALDRKITFENNTLWVEKNFNLAYAEKNQLPGGEHLVFDMTAPLQYVSHRANAHTVEITFPRAVLKRELFLRLKGDFIYSAQMRQQDGSAVLKIILNRGVEEWSAGTRGDQWVFRAAKNKTAAPIVRAPEPAAVGPETYLSSAQPTGPKPAVLLPAPSVMEEDSSAAPEKAETAEKAPEKSAVPAQTAPQVQAGKTAVVQSAPGATLSPATQKPAAPAKPAAKELKPAVIHQGVESVARKKMRIMVDPGHGGKDPGAVRRKQREKDWNLAVAKELYALLKKGGFEVRMTRDKDVFIPLSDRSKQANNFKADLFVSVHTNASKNSRANGFQVYFRSEKATDKEAAEVAALENEAMQYEEVHYNFVDALLQSLAKNEYINESSKLAGYVRNAVFKQPGIGIAVNRNSSVRQANFYVLKGVNSPAILVEMGYISSPKDRGRLSQAAVRKKMAQGLYNGIHEYAKKEGWLK